MHRGYSALRPVCVLMALAALAASAQNLDEIGVTALSAVAPGVDGSGIRVAQPEANADGDTNHPSAFEVSPAVVSQPTNRFAYASALGAATGFTNAVGSESGHANSVGAYFYGRTGHGSATNVAHVDNFDAEYFINFYVFSNLATLPDPVVNQSFTFGNLTVSEQQAVDSAYDDYAAGNGTIFVSAANNLGNSGVVRAPGTAYNSISVGAYYNGTYGNSIGPTIDNGRCKPDITAPNAATSFSTPQVAGAAALMLQASARGDGGSDTNAATDLRTVKALLLNGAVKPADWTNSASSPLDMRYGAGMVNVLNSYQQLAGGKNPASTSNSIPLGAAPIPATATNLISVLSGWNFTSIASDAADDSEQHYYFDAPNGLATATLVWNRQFGQTNINDLDLLMFDANNHLVAVSTSRVDNVEHIFLPRLAAGKYDLLVLKHGGTNVVSDAETYALAWAFVSPELTLTKSGANMTVSWPAYPAGFRVETTTNLTTGNWSTNNLPAVTLAGGTNLAQVPTTNGARFFRLRQPNF